MSKKIILGGGLLLLLAVFMHFVTGIIAQRATLALQQKVLSDTDQFGEFEIQNYQRGLFASEASFAWKPPAALGVLSDDRVVFECLGDHGVISYVYNCNVRDWAGYKEFVDAKLEGNDPLSIRGSVSLGEEIDTKISLREFRFQTDTDELVTVASGELDVRTNPEARRFEINGIFDGAELVSGSNRAKLEAFAVDADLHINEHQIVIGEAVAAIGSAVFNADQNSLKVSRLNLTTSTIERAENFEFSYRLQVPELEQRSLQSGVEKKYENLDVLFAIGGINMADFSKFYRNFKRIDEKTSDATRSGEAKSDSNANFLAMLPQFEDLFREGATLNSKIAVESSASKTDRLDAEIKIHLLRNLRFADYILMRVQPGALMAKFDAEFNASIPDSIAAGRFAASNSPWYVPKGDYSVSQVRVEGEDITINNRSVTPREFIRLIF